MSLTAYICTTCGVQYEPSVKPPQKCHICEDDRQYVNPSGQQWTTLEEINRNYSNKIEEVKKDLYAIYTEPSFAIGQRAHLLITPRGNILWDCISNIDNETIKKIKELGGIKSIAISHPHYFSTIIEWSQKFDGAPVYINSSDQEWLGRKNEHIKFWEGETENLWDGIQLVRCGGHFPGASVLYWPEGKSLLTGDTIQVAPNLKTVSFMYSYPNMIPLTKKDIIQIDTSVKNLDYDAMYGAFGKYIEKNARACMESSVRRYLSIY